MKLTVVLITASLLLSSNVAIASKKAKPIDPRRACKPTFAEKVEDHLNGYRPYCRNKVKEEWDRNRRHYHHKTRDHQQEQTTQYQRNNNSRSRR